MAHETSQTGQLTCVPNPCSDRRLSVEFTIAFAAYFRSYRPRRRNSFGRALIIPLCMRVRVPIYQGFEAPTAGSVGGHQRGKREGDPTS